MPVDRQRCALLLAAALPLSAWAADAPKPAPTPIAPPQAASAADAELLEFLGEFADDKGDFVDPFVIDSADRELKDAARATEKKKGTDKTKAADAAAPAPDQAPPEKKP
jgi:hypothetical protein